MSAPRQTGVHATPRPLTGYLVRSVHALLQSRLGKPLGLADPSVRLLDPAAGPMNFLLAAWRLALAGERRNHGEPAGARLLAEHLLPHSVGLELLRAPHLQGHVAAGRLLASYGLASARPRLYRADTLADPGPGSRVKIEERFSVVLGNPPWQGHSLHRGSWITGLLGDYRVAGEKNPKWLQDDAVKFLRFAQWKIEQNGEGVAALVLPHTLLDAPTFRGLRGSLLSTFEEVYALDLHGNGRKRERAPDGGRDENVFSGVAQGVLVLFLVKRPGLPRRVLRADLYGTRRAKHRALGQGHVGTTRWAEVRPRAPGFLLIRGDDLREREYRRGFSLPEIFPCHGPGVVSGQDALFTALSRRELIERCGESRPVRRYLARPFDLRYLLYSPQRLARPRVRLMAPMLPGDNLGLVACRQCREEPGALVTRWIPGHKAFSAYDISSLFPLHLAPDRAPELGRRVPNLSPALCLHLAGLYGEVPSAEAVLGYVYAVLSSPAYRARFRDLLRRDFPRVPFPRGGRLFAQLSGLGGELVALHLLRDPRLLRPAVRLVGDPRLPLGSLLDYREAEQRLCCGRKGAGEGHGFAGVAPEVWRYPVGGYPVLRQWLRARAGRVLGAAESLAFRRVAAALALTIETQKRIEEVGCDVESTALRAA